MSFALSARGNAQVVALSGEIDMGRAPTVRQAVLEAIKTKAPVVVVEMSAVTYMDSSGIATLVEGLQNAKKQGTDFVLAGPAGNVLGVLKLARLDKVFRILPDLAACDELSR